MDEGGVIECKEFVPTTLGLMDSCYEDAFKGAQKAVNANEDFNEKAQTDELQCLSKKMAEALHGIQQQKAKNDATEATRLTEHIEAGAIVLPAGKTLASMWDPMTWAYAFMALFPHGDLVPYFDRKSEIGETIGGVSMSLRETFAYPVSTNSGR